MRKDWLGVALASLVLAACSAPEQQNNTAPPQPAYNGPVVEIPGVEPRYEPINPSTSQDYSVNGKNYRVIKDPSNYSEVGLATWYGAEAQGNRTAIGESYDPDALTAAHPTMPLPSYVRVMVARSWCVLMTVVRIPPAASLTCLARQVTV